MKEYEQVFHADVNEFKQRVNALAKEGWRVIGYQVVKARLNTVSFVLMEREIPNQEAE